MGKKILDECGKQDRRLKMQEAAVFKSSKNNPKASTDLVIAEAAPESKNREIVHVKRANKQKKYRPNTQVTSNPSKELKLIYGSSNAGDELQPACTKDYSRKNHELDEPESSLPSDAQQLTVEALAGDEIPVNGEDNTEREISDMEGSSSSKDGNVSIRDLSTGKPISKRKSRMNRTPLQKKIAVQIKAGSSSKLETAIMGPITQDGNGNVTIRKKSDEGKSDILDATYDAGNTSLNGNNTNGGRSLTDERKHSKQKRSEPGERLEFSIPVQQQNKDGFMDGNKRNNGSTTGNIPKFSLIDHTQNEKLEEIAPEGPRPKTNVEANKQSWRNMFTGNRNALADYKLTKDPSAVPTNFIELTEQDADDLSEHWGFALLAYVAGRSTGKQAIDDCCKKWGVPYVLHFHESGWIIIKFSSEEDRDKVLLQGPYYVFGKLLMLKELPKFFDFSNYEINLIPIWVHIFKLPLDFWNVRSLSKLGGFLGKPIQTDKITYTRGRVSFVRILVEMDLSKSLPDTIPVKLPNGRLIEAKVEYEFIPKICMECKGIGHGEDRCFLLHPELKPKNQPANMRAKESENTVAAKKNYAYRNISIPKNSSEADKVATKEFHNSFSQTFDLNQTKTSWKKVSEPGSRSTQEFSATEVNETRHNYFQPLSLNTEKPDRGKQVLVASVEMQDNQLNIRSSVKGSNSGLQEREQRIASNRGCSPKNAQNQHRVDTGSHSESAHHSGSDIEDGEFQIPNKRHTTRNMNWSKAVLIPDNSLGRGPTPSSPQ